MFLCTAHVKLAFGFAIVQILFARYCARERRICLCIFVVWLMLIARVFLLFFLLTVSLSHSLLRFQVAAFYHFHGITRNIDFDIGLHENLPTTTK